MYFENLNFKLLFLRVPWTVSNERHSKMTALLSAFRRFWKEMTILKFSLPILGKTDFLARNYKVGLQRNTGKMLGSGRSGSVIWRYSCSTIVKSCFLLLVTYVECVYQLLSKMKVVCSTSALIESFSFVFFVVPTHLPEYCVNSDLISTKTIRILHTDVFQNYEALF